MRNALPRSVGAFPYLSTNLILRRSLNFVDTIEVETQIEFNVFEWSSIDELFLEAVEVIRKAESFSNADFAKLFKFKSRAHLRLVLQGNRGITEPMIATLIRKFNWNKMEARYVLSLWKLSQNPSDEEKATLYRMLSTSAQYKKTKMIDSHAQAYLTHWWIVAYREALFLEWFHKLSDEEQAKRLGIDLGSLKEAQECLLALGLVEFTENQWVPIDVPLKASRSLLKTSAEKFHRMMAQKALEALNPLDKETQEFQSLTLPISPDKVAQIREIVLDCAREIRSMATAKGEGSVYQLNFQFFPLITPTPPKNK